MATHPPAVPNKKPGSRSNAGGQSAIAGFLFQILRSVQLGLQVIARIYCEEAETGQQTMQLVLEPVEGGDHRINEGCRMIVEQVKMRRGSRVWSSGIIAREVFPDLLKAVELGRLQNFRFVTDNSSGLTPLCQFLAHWQTAGDTGTTFAWGTKQLTAPAFLDELAKAAAVSPSDPRFIALIDNLSIEVIDTLAAEREIEALIGRILAPGEDASAKRHELTMRLLNAASVGQTIDAASLLGLIDPQAILRLGHVQSLPALLDAALRRDIVALGYAAAGEARTAVIVPNAALTIYSGESGQGKTWSLCQSALAQCAKGEWAIVMRAPSNVPEIIEILNERLWRPAFTASVTPQILAQRLMHAAPSDGFWLTVYIDDIQNRTLAEAIARLDWHIYGIRIVISAQPRITSAIKRQNATTIVQPIGNFTGAELRRFLAHHGRESTLDKMPDDVLELLLKPIHAFVFTQLPERPGWSNTSEYELFKAYWNYATSEARDQYDHRSDRDALIALAGSLLGPAPRYPWPLRDARAAGLDDAAIVRLEAVGLIRWVDADALQFAADRMLNWAVAEHICSRALDEQWPASRVDAELQRIDDITASEDEPVGRRLGYVFLDLLWLLAGRRNHELVADIIWAQVQQLPHEWRSASMWSDHLATIGATLIPALELLAQRDFEDESDRDVPRHIPVALAAIGQSDRVPVIETAGRLLAAGSDSLISIALGIASRLAAPELVDALWREHVKRQRAFARCDHDPDRVHDRTEKMLRRDLSWRALRRAVPLAIDFLDRQIASTCDPFELNQLLWLVMDDGVSDEQATQLWLRHRAHLLSHVATDSTAMVAALWHFDDRSNKSWLDTVPLMRDNAMGDRVLRSRARIAPPAALCQIENAEDEYLGGAANWWIEELAAADADGMASAIMHYASRGDHPLAEVILFYEKAPHLIDGPTLEWVLDQFATALREFNDVQTDEELGRLGHPLRFLTNLTEPWQFDQIAKRAGTLLERELVRLATGRDGRSSRIRDSDGESCAQLLAMIAGNGFDQLVLAELDRADGFGREDGYLHAHWTESAAVKAALINVRDDDARDDYRKVIAMQALAIHQCDDALEQMVRADAPIYVNAAEMRSAEGRSTDGLRARIETLIASNEPDEQRIAAKLAGFLSEASQAEILLPLFTDEAVGVSVKQAIVGTFNALGFYDPSMLTAALPMLAGRIDDEAQFLAAYLAAEGDAEARKAVSQWLTHLDVGTWSNSRDAFIAPLLRHEESRPAVIDFLRRSRQGGHRLIDSQYLRLLAENDDTDAHHQLLDAAYRKPRASFLGTGAAIDYLRTLDREEAFFAARRYFARHESVEAVALMIDIDPAAAAPLLIDAYRRARPSLKDVIARQLRIKLTAEHCKGLINELAAGKTAQDRAIAAELAGWMPPGMAFDWLQNFASQGSPKVRLKAQASLRRRSREAAAMEHLSAMEQSSKPLKWVRLRTIIALVDPDFLWLRGDPASLQTFIDTHPPEFVVEAWQLRSQAIKKRDDRAKRADKDWR
jgi:hypothetical protein